MPISAAEALAHVTKMNNRRRSKFNPKLRQAGDPVYIYNLCPFDMPYKWRTRDCGSLGRYILPTREEGEEISKPLVIDAFLPDEYDMGLDGNMGMNIQDGEGLAKAIIGIDSTTPQLDLLTTNREWFGIFMSKSNPPKKQEIAEATKKLEQMMTLLLQRGDKLAAAGKVDQIGVQERKAATYKKQVRDWNKPPVTMEECPVCATPIRPGVAFCVTCKSVLNPQKYEQYQAKNEKTPTTVPAR
jgi:hypothetical protein